MKTALRLILAVLMAVIVMNLAGGIGMAVGKMLPEGTPKALISGFLMQTGLLVFSLVAMLLLGRGKLSGFGFALPKQAPWRLIISMGFGVGSAAAVIMAIAFFGESPLNIEFSPLQTILMIWIYASICEEVFTRGLLQGFLAPVSDRGITVWRRRLSLPVLVSAAVFGLMHLSLLSTGSPFAPVLAVVVFAFCLGLIAGYYREKTASLLPAIVVHSLFNISGSLIGWIAGALSV